MARQGSRIVVLICQLERVKAQPQARCFCQCRDMAANKVTGNRTERKKTINLGKCHFGFPKVPSAADHSSTCRARLQASSRPADGGENVI
jgi:hypothetical protein